MYENVNVVLAFAWSCCVYLRREINFFSKFCPQAVPRVCMRICEDGGEIELCQRADGIQRASECAATVLFLHNRVVLVTSEELSFVRLMLCGDCCRFAW